MKQIRLGNDADVGTPANMDPEAVASRPQTLSVEDEAAEQAKLLRASKIAKSTTAALTAILLVLWPMPLYGTGYVFSLKFFSGWVVVGIIWLMCSTLAVGVYPLWEGRHSLKHTFTPIWKDLSGRRAETLAGKPVVSVRRTEDLTIHGKDGGEKSGRW